MEMKKFEDGCSIITKLSIDNAVEDVNGSSCRDFVIYQLIK